MERTGVQRNGSTDLLALCEHDAEWQCRELNRHLLPSICLILHPHPGSGTGDRGREVNGNLRFDVPRRQRPVCAREHNDVVRKRNIHSTATTTTTTAATATTTTATATTAATATTTTTTTTATTATTATAATTAPIKRVQHLSSFHPC